MVQFCGCIPFIISKIRSINIVPDRPNFVKTLKYLFLIQSLTAKLVIHQADYSNELIIDLAHIILQPIAMVSIRTWIGLDLIS